MKYVFWLFSRMKCLILQNMWAVGMHHWGPKELEIGMGYILEREPNNPYDPNAVVIKVDGKKKAYLKKNNAFVISNVMKMECADIWRIKPK